MGLQRAALPAASFVAATLTILLIWAPDFVNAVHPPEIIKKPQNQGVRVGGVASFYCAARGDPPPSIVWRKNAKKVSGTQSRYTVLEQPGGISILRIEPVRAGRDDAPYECVAENGVGDAVSADATLTVYEVSRCKKDMLFCSDTPL
ncbi:tyrosine-protein phosphatase Lar-like [Teleopsis dalmanni]|uniref:tyrosine-protein phosphatase Lar-like n=1 Tax=Teleopsis dalmanni TaxID=139649 RepID=UPI0018CDBFD8|nr:tyrosine-protein phosphatase Lar-like [Teleopsis dalmanni]